VQNYCKFSPFQGALIGKRAMTSATLCVLSENVSQERTLYVSGGQLHFTHVGVSIMWISPAPFFLQRFVFVFIRYNMKHFRFPGISLIKDGGHLPEANRKFLSTFG